MCGKIRRAMAAAAIIAAGAAAPAPAPYVPDLLPAAPPAGQAFRNLSLSSWGGNVVRDESGRYHLFAAAMTAGCNLDAWKSNSMVVHAESATPTGPFTFVDVSLPRWHHNPHALRLPDGTWLLYTIGTVSVPAERHCDSSESVGAENEGDPVQFVQCHYARSPRGPWTFLNVSGDASNPGIFSGNETNNNDYGTNPAPAVLPNGTVVVAAHDTKGVYVQVATSWRGPYRRAPGYLFTFEGGLMNWVCEDPFLWFDGKADRWRMLVHEYPRGFGRGGGGAAATLTPDLLGPWDLQPHGTPAYTTSVRDTDGAAEVFARRERPMLLLDAAGEPAVLYTGVCPKNAASGGGSELCYTHAQKLAPRA